MTLFQRLANKEFSIEHTHIIERACELAKTNVNTAIYHMVCHLPYECANRSRELVFFDEKKIWSQYFFFFQ